MEGVPWFDEEALLCIVVMLEERERARGGGINGRERETIIIKNDIDNECDGVFCKNLSFCSRMVESPHSGPTTNQHSLLNARSPRKSVKILYIETSDQRYTNADVTPISHTGGR